MSVSILVNTVWGCRCGPCAEAQLFDAAVQGSNVHFLHVTFFSGVLCICVTLGQKPHEVDFFCQ